MTGGGLSPGTNRRKPMKHKFAVFLDRDGTVTEEIGYVTDPKRLRLIPSSAEAISLLNSRQIPVILATNQAGVARGYFREEMIGKCHERLEEMLGSLGARLDAIYYCPHHPSVGEPPYRLDCNCRKPKPGMFLKAAEQFRIELSSSYMIGDKASDLEAAKVAGAHPLLVRTGYGTGEISLYAGQWKVAPEAIFENLFEAASYIIEKEETA
jgi:D-glycero-D-manno-heptose 1,7-bisphosphate phosphatase